MKNDVSFMICDRLFLYEHQSTKNPNMPLRNLLYVADLYSVLTKDMFLYGELPVAIPEPRFVVFYNGEQKMEERSVFVCLIFIAPEPSILTWNWKHWYYTLTRVITQN